MPATRKTYCAGLLLSALLITTLGCIDAHLDSVAQHDTVYAESSVYDGGDINLPEGKAFIATFKLINAGDRTASIVRIVTSCGCITVEDAPTHIHADQSVSINLTVSVPPAPGPFRKQAMVFLDETPPRSIPLTIIGNVDGKDLIRSTPDSVDLGELYSLPPESRDTINNSLKTSTISIRRFDELPFEIKRVESSAEWLDATCDTCNSNAAASVHTVHIRASNIAGEGGVQDEYLAIYQENKVDPLNVPVKAYLYTPSDYLKKSILVGNARAGDVVLLDLRSSLARRLSIAPKLVGVSTPPSTSLSIISSGSPAPYNAELLISVSSPSGLQQSTIQCNLPTEDKTYSIPLSVLVE